MRWSCFLLCDQVEDAANRSELLRIDSRHREIDVMCGLEITDDLQNCQRINESTGNQSLVFFQGVDGSTSLLNPTEKSQEMLFIVGA